MRKQTRRKQYGLHPLVKQAYHNEFVRKSRNFKIKALMMEDGADAADLLSELMVVIGSSCQAGAYQFGKIEWVVELHQALDTIAEMCNDGFKWKASEASYLCDACDLAEEKMPELAPNHFGRAYVDAESVAWEIKERKWRQEAIASV